jgi:hypothetical protein
LNLLTKLDDKQDLTNEPESLSQNVSQLNAKIEEKLEKILNSSDYYFKHVTGPKEKLILK